MKQQSKPRDDVSHKRERKLAEQQRKAERAVARRLKREGR